MNDDPCDLFINTRHKLSHVADLVVTFFGKMLIVTNVKKYHGRWSINTSTINLELDENEDRRTTVKCPEFLRYPYLINTANELDIPQHDYRRTIVALADFLSQNECSVVPACDFEEMFDRGGV